MPDKQFMSDYKEGDVLLKLHSSDEKQIKITCDVGMATAAAMYRLEPEKERSVEIKIPLRKVKHQFSNNHKSSTNLA